MAACSSRSKIWCDWMPLTAPLDATASEIAATETLSGNELMTKPSCYPCIQ